MFGGHEVGLEGAAEFLLGHQQGLDCLFVGNFAQIVQPQVDVMVEHIDLKVQQRKVLDYLERPYLSFAVANSDGFVDSEVGVGGEVLFRVSHHVLIRNLSEDLFEP